MSAIIIDGKAVSNKLRSEFSRRIAEFKHQGYSPGLAVVLVGNHAASQVYVRNKIAACATHGIISRLEQLPENTKESQLLALIDRLNHDPTVDGILIQLPLPKQINTETIISAIAPRKDVDGFGLEHAGALMVGKPMFIPCTPAGVMEMLDAYHIPIDGAETVVVGRSNIVGKPMAMLLLSRGATVTLCHSQTRDIAVHTRHADIVIMAVGQPQLLNASMIKPGAAIIDVGINRDVNNKLCGDVDFESVVLKAGWITPVPGGVGPMTITMLLKNTVDAATYNQSKLLKQ